MIPRISPNMTFSIKTFSIFFLSELERKTHLEAVPEHSCAVFLESFGNMLCPSGGEVWLAGPKQKCQPQTEDPAGTWGSGKPKCSLPADLRAVKSIVINFLSVFCFTSIYIMLFLSLYIIQNSLRHWLVRFDLTMFIGYTVKWKVNYQKYLFSTLDVYTHTPLPLPQSCPFLNSYLYSSYSLISSPNCPRFSWNE